MIKEAIVKIVNKEDLTYDEAYAVMNEIMSGETTSTQNAAFLAALSTKSARAETTEEIAGCAAAMRAHATKVETGMELFEIVGGVFPVRNGGLPGSPWSKHPAESCKMQGTSEGSRHVFLLRAGIPYFYEIRGRSP